MFIFYFQIFLKLYTRKQHNHSDYSQTKALRTLASFLSLDFPGKGIKWSNFKVALPLRNRQVRIKGKGGRVSNDLGRIGNIIVNPKMSF